MSSSTATAVAAVIVDIVALTAAITTTVALASSVATAITLTDVANATALTRQEAEAPVDGRNQCDKRQHDNQPDKRDKRGVTRGGVATRGVGAGEREVSV